MHFASWDNSQQLKQISRFMQSSARHTRRIGVANSDSSGAIGYRAVDVYRTRRFLVRSEEAEIPRALLAKSLHTTLSSKWIYTRTLLHVDPVRTYVRHAPPPRVRYIRGGTAQRK